MSVAACAVCGVHSNFVWFCGDRDWSTSRFTCCGRSWSVYVTTFPGPPSAKLRLPSTLRKDHRRKNARMPIVGFVLGLCTKNDVDRVPSCLFRFNQPSSTTISSLEHTNLCHQAFYRLCPNTRLNKYLVGVRVQSRNSPIGCLLVFEFVRSFYHLAYVVTMYTY